MAKRKRNRIVTGDGIFNSLSAWQTYVTRNGTQAAVYSSPEADPPSVTQVATALAWLTEFAAQTKTVCRTGAHSYGLKHTAESWAREKFGYQSGYISNGAFIAAALLAGYTASVINRGPNCYLNLATITRVDPAARRGAAC